MGKLREFLAFVFAAFLKSEEDADSKANKLVRLSTWVSFLISLSPWHFLLPAPRGRLVSIDTFVSENVRPLSWLLLPALMAWGAFEKYTLEKTKKEQLSKDISELTRKKFDVVYSWEDCLKQGLYSDKPEEEGLLLRAHTVLRIGVKTNSLSTVRNVTVKHGRGKRTINSAVQVGQQFRRTHGDNRSFDLQSSSDPMVLIDLCEHEYWIGEDSKITFPYGNPVGFAIAKGSPFDVECAVVVQGDDAPEVTRAFRITIDHSQKWPVSMAEIP